MVRLHLFEFNDQPWLPTRLRDYQTDTLAALERLGAPFRPAVPVVRDALRHAPAPRIVDLCSGAGGPLQPILQRLEAWGDAPEVVLTDLFPNQEAFARQARRLGPRCSFRAEPVDAASVPADLVGLRTIFNAFHHFRPPVARRVLADAARARQPICVVEVPERRLSTMATFLALPLLVCATTPGIRPFRWGRLAWTYGVPAIPLLVGFDGVVSCLRSYAPRELLALAPRVEGYRWDAGQEPIPLTPLHLTWLVGRPT